MGLAWLAGLAGTTGASMGLARGLAWPRRLGAHAMPQLLHQSLHDLLGVPRITILEGTPTAYDLQILRISMFVTKIFMED